MLSCCQGCIRPATRYANGALTFHSANHDGRTEQKRSTRVALPPEFRTDYDAMVRRTPLKANPPILELYDTLHGVGGMFIADPDQWVIVVGIQDMREIAAGVVARWETRVATIFANSSGGWPNRDQVHAFAFAAAMRRCTAHEIGHALLAAGSANPYAPDAEAGADYYAGRLDAACGRNRELGEMFFFSIGCVGTMCDHPSPSARATAYGKGYEDQQRTA